LHKDIIPSIYWNKTNHSVIGLGNKSIQMNYEIPKATMCFRDYCLGLKFVFLEIPIACILGTPFLETIELHGSERTPEGKQDNFITNPSIQQSRKVVKKTKVIMPFASTPYLSTMVQMAQALKQKERKITEFKELKNGMRIEDKIKNPKTQEAIHELQC